MASIQIAGPYRVKNIGMDGNMWEVVEMEDIQKNIFHQLRPRRVYTEDQRQAAYGLCKRLNLKWQKEHELDENYDEMMEKFR
jgi:hypothetical protein